MNWWGEGKGAGAGAAGGRGRGPKQGEWGRQWGAADGSQFSRLPADQRTAVTYLQVFVQ